MRAALHQPHALVPVLISLKPHQLTIDATVYLEQILVPSSLAHLSLLEHKNLIAIFNCT